MKPFTATSAMFLGLLAVLQLVRFISGWEVSVNGMDVPVWASAVAFVISGALALLLWKENRARAPGTSTSQGQLK